MAVQNTPGHPAKDSVDSFLEVFEEALCDQGFFDFEKNVHQDSIQAISR